MDTILVAISTWLHTLATVVMVGYFFFTSQIFLPVLARRMPADAVRETLEHVSARLKPYFGGSLLIFLITGTHVMLINEDYLGLGNFFVNPWSIWIIVKHVVVVAFLALAVFSERVYLAKIGADKPQALQRFQLALQFDLLLGAAILLLTVLAQAG